MKIDLQDVTDTRKTLAVTLDADEVATEEKSLLSQFKGMAKIPGFRPGKAPEGVVRKRFAKEIAGELKQRVTAKAYRDGVKEAGVDLINPIDSVSPQPLILQPRSNVQLERGNAVHRWNHLLQLSLIHI